MIIHAGEGADIQLFPFTLTRDVLDIRIGILTLREKWLLHTGSAKPDGLPSNILPTISTITTLQKSGGLTELSDSVFISRPWHIFEYNDLSIREDYKLLTAGRTTQPLPVSNQVINPAEIFLEAGARVECSILNASTGPIYIGKNAHVMEGCMIRGPFALCEGAVLKMGTRVYGATTIGPFSVGGGEIKNSVIFGYSNKAHDGYLGDSVLGEWCNLGAGTTNSNLKNNAADVRVFVPGNDLPGTPGKKCGLLMGDYSRSAINTSFNTGTVTGVCCNIFSEGLTSTYIPSFSWGGRNAVRYNFDNAIRDISNWKKLKNHSLRDEEVSKLRNIFDNL